MDSERVNKWSENNEHFMRTTYCGFNVIMHIESGYYNVTKLCSDYGKEFKNLKRNQGFVQHANYLRGIPHKFGYLYLLKFGDYVKIGRTYSIESRYPYEIRKNHLQKLVEVSDMYALEKVLIKRFNKHFAVYKNKEYFRYDTDEDYEKMLKIFDDAVNSSSDISINDDLDIMLEFIGYSNKSRGTYIHPILINYVCTWLSDNYSIMVSKIMSLNAEKAQLTSALNEARCKALKTETMSEINGDSSIRIYHPYKKSNTYHLFADTKIQDGNNKNIQVIPLYNAYDTLRLMNYYAKYNCTKLVKQITPNIFEANYEDLIAFLYQVSENTLAVNIDYDLLINRILSSKRVKRNYKPNLFEIYCSQQFNIPLFKFALTESVGLYKHDRGCDLFDINNKVTGQCKYFIKSSLNERYLNKYFEFVDAMSYDDNYLFVNEDITFAPSLILYNENLEQINDNSTIDRTKDIYIKTTEDNYISVKFVNVDKFELFVTELEDKYDEHVSYEDFMALLTSFTLKHIQLQRERINSYNNQKIIQEKIKKFNELRIHDNKDEQFECTIFKEQREYLKKLIEENPLGIEVNDCIKMINDKFNTSYDVIRFGHKFSDLYQHNSNSTFPVINGQKMILPVKQINNEIDFIIKYIGIKDILVSEYIKIHNEKFNTTYTTNTFAHSFGKLFKNDGSCFARRTIDGKRVHVLELINTDRHEKVNETINNILKTYEILPVVVLIYYIQHEYNIYYSPKSFKKEYTNYVISKGERFTEKSTKCLERFINSFDGEFKEELNKMKEKLSAPNFIKIC